MRRTILVSMVSGLLISGLPVGAQQFWYIPQVDDSKTPIENELASPELAMPGFGISSSRSQLMKRFEYALDHKWLTSAQVDQFCNDLKNISDKETSLRDESGNLNGSSRSTIAKQLASLNNRFEDTVLVREQSNPGIEGLQAREALMLQRVGAAVSQGKMTHKKAAEMKQEIKSIMAKVPEKDMSQDLQKEVASDLNRIGASLEKDMRGPSMASRVTPFSR
jgi:hypothetical protein